MADCQSGEGKSEYKISSLPIAESRLFPCIHYHQCRVSVCEVDVKDRRLILYLEWAIDDRSVYIISIALAIGVALRLC